MSVDLPLLMMTLSGMQLMYNICENYAEEYNIKFNGSKSRLLLFNGRQCKTSIKSLRDNGLALECVDSVMDLGHAVSSNAKYRMVTAAKTSFWRAFNLFMSDFGHISSVLKGQLFRQYCCSFYGAPLWYLKSDGVEAICVAWPCKLYIECIHQHTVISLLLYQDKCLYCLI